MTNPSTVRRAYEKALQKAGLRASDRAEVLRVYTRYEYGEIGPNVALEQLRQLALEPWTQAPHPGLEDGTGYELTDPKHPTYYERMTDAYDNRRKG
jgi:hypothetical protein